MSSPYLTPLLLKKLATRFFWNSLNKALKQNNKLNFCRLLSLKRGYPTSFKSEVVFNMDMISKNIENREMQQHTDISPGRLSQMAGQVLESLTDKNMTATMEFQNLEIDMPKAQGPQGRELGSAKWIVNGKVLWTTELHKT